MSGLPFYVTQGQGDTAVFLLHGVGGGHAAFDTTTSVLAQQGYRTIAWDAPGYGESAPIEPLDMKGLADSLSRLVRHVGAKRNVILGHSMGGMIAQEAMAQPQLGPSAEIDGLILFATSPSFGKPGGDWQREFLQSRFAALDAGLGMVGLAPLLVGGMMALGTPARVRAAAIAMMSTVPESTYRAALAAIVSFNRLENLPNIRVPALCLACDEDKTAPPAVMEKMASKMPAASYQCLSQAGHLGNLEQPASFNAAVLQFLQKNFPVQE
jgi:pimeloyl-ACP methyl ester carboxylesterase